MINAWEMHETRKWEVHAVKVKTKLLRTDKGAASFFFRGDSGKWLPFGSRKEVIVSKTMQVVPCDYDGQVWAVPKFRLTLARKAFRNTTKVEFVTPENMLVIRQGARRLRIRCYMLLSGGRAWA